MLIQYSGYNIVNILYFHLVCMSTSVYIVIECCTLAAILCAVCMYVFDSMLQISIPCHEGPPATRGHFCSEPEMAARGRYYCITKPMNLRERRK